MVEALVAHAEVERRHEIGLHATCGPAKTAGHLGNMIWGTRKPRTLHDVERKDRADQATKNRAI